MRLWLLAGALGLLTSPAANAQWLETTIHVTDSLCGLAYPQSLAYNPISNTIYVGGQYGDDVIAIDGMSNLKVARIPTGKLVTAICVNPQNNKVYCASQLSDSVLVLDGASDSVIASVPSRRRPRVLCYGQQNNRVYCANGWSANVKVIDGATNRVIATVTVSDYPTAFCHNPQDNKIYCANSGRGDVTAIDGATNSIVGVVDVGGEPLAFAQNPGENRTYLANHGNSGISVLRNSMSGIEESCRPQASDLKLTATIVRGALYLRPSPLLLPVGEGQDVRGQSLLLDATGRRVLSLRPGPNDVSGLAPGVYFVRSGPDVSRIVIPR